MQSDKAKEVKPGKPELLEIKKMADDDEPFLMMADLQELLAQKRMQNKQEPKGRDKQEPLHTDDTEFPENIKASTSAKYESCLDQYENTQQ